MSLESAPQAETTTVEASCHCKANTFTLSLPTASLPLKAFMCDCRVCHRNIGAYFAHHVPLPHPLIPDRAHPPHSVKEYRSSDHLSRYFCSSCGACLGFYTHPRDAWYISAGLLDRADGIFEIATCIFAGSNKDAGILSHLAADFPRYAEVTGALFVPPASGTLTAKVEDTLKARCRCGNVEVTIHRPSYAPIAEDIRTSVVAASSPEKWTAEHDLCTSCRKTSGFPCSTWSSIPVSHFTVSPTTQWSRYKSSEDVERLFCGTCMANAFYTRGKNPDRWDLALGIVDMGDEPALAFLNEWFEFSKTVLYPEDAIDTKFKESLLRGVESL